MKKALISCVALLATIAVVAQEQKPAPSATPAQQQQPATPPGTKTPPQAKTQEEFKAYQDAVAVVQKGDPAQGEAAADAFVSNFKGSEIAPILYHIVLQQYQAQNNPDKATDVGRKILGISPNDPIANVLVASMISERVRDTDLDRDERLAEAEKDAKRSLQTIDTDFAVNPGTPQERIDASKSMLRSMAYAALANVEAARLNYPGAENYFKQAANVPGAQMDSVTWLRYALLLDKQRKYTEALGIINKAIESAPAGTPERDLAQKEHDRLTMLVSGASPATSPKPAPTPAGQAPSAPKQ